MTPHVQSSGAETRGPSRKASEAEFSCGTAALGCAPAQFPFSSPVSLAVAVLFLFFHSFAPSARAQSSAQPTPVGRTRTVAIEIDGGLGSSEFQSEIKPGFWYPLWIVLKANEAGASGMMTVSQDGNSLKVQIPFEVAKGSSKRFLSYYKPFDRDRAAPKLNVLVETAKLGRDDFILPLRFAPSNDDHHILVLCDEPGSYSFLTRRVTDILADGPMTERRPHYASPELLPDEPLSLEPFDAIIVATDRAKRIRPESWAAIEQWVWLGGRVLLAGGKHHAFFADSPLDGAFGLKLSDPEPVDFERALRGDEGTSQTQLLAAFPANPPEFWTSIRAGDAARPILAERRVGRGRFIYSSVALDTPVVEVINARRESRDLWASLLERKAGPVPFIADANASAADYGSALQASFGVALAKTSWVFLYLAVYIILAVPFNWWICARLKRREMAWGVAILLALAFSFLGYRSGAIAQGRAAQSNQVAFVSRPSGSPVARAVALESVFSPRRLSADLKCEGIALPTSFGSAEGYDPFGRPQVQNRDSDSVRFGRSTQFDDFFLHPMSARNLQTEFTLPLPAGVELLPPSSSGFAATLKNNTPWTFSMWAFRDTHRVWDDGGRPLKPGQSIDLPDHGFTDTTTASQLWHATLERIEFAAAPLLGASGYNLRARRQAALYANQPNGPFAGRRGAIANQAYAFQQASAPEVAFRGLADAQLSPLLGSIESPLRKHSLFYEELFQADEIRKILGGDTAFSDVWLLTPGEPVANLADFSSDRDGGANLAFKQWWLRLTPYFKFEPPRGEALEISMKFTLVADSAGMFKMAKALGRDYVARGCKLHVFNRRANSWQDRGVWLGEPIRLQPAEDYLDPETSAIAIQLDLDKHNLYFLPAGETELDAADLLRNPIRASDLFGLKTGPADSAAYRGYFRNEWKLYSVRISGVSVRRVPAAPKPDPAQGAAP